ncbi:hypothetical protein LFZ16_08180 [Salmonella enterica subsp. enterica serovar India str. SA20085604]|nr:hypothetical protein LFZ16_08180 [Salmonella enterica subsp. enterica serovar India str. SA20085604]
MPFLNQQTGVLNQHSDPVNTELTRATPFVSSKWGFVGSKISTKLFKNNMLCDFEPTNQLNYTFFPVYRERKKNFMSSEPKIVSLTPAIAGWWAKFRQDIEWYSPVAAWVLVDGVKKDGNTQA